MVQLVRTGITEIDSPEFVIRTRENPPRTVIDDEDAIPKAFKVKETIVTIRKDEIRNDSSGVPSGWRLQLDAKDRLRYDKAGLTLTPESLWLRCGHQEPCGACGCST